MPDINFQHRYAAHCESGVVSSLLHHYGLPVSEAMVFGLSGALTLAYIPLIKLNGLPLIAYRMPPRHILKKSLKRMGIALQSETFRKPEQGMQRLDQLLQQGIPVGMQTSVYWLPYFPPDMRFHFNAHNLICYGKEGDNYAISDPIAEHATQCDSRSLQKARFVKGALAPKGFLYHLSGQPQTPQLDKLIPAAIKSNVKIHLSNPFPFIGINGIRLLSRKVRALQNQHASKEAYNKLYLGHIVRMQEEIGTGGAGFRFIYASFLQESAAILDSTLLAECSQELTETGDEWRRFALYTAKMCKDRMPMDYDKLADQLLHCADREREVFSKLKAFKPATN